jgi:outer membrane protein TolC
MIGFTSGSLRASAVAGIAGLSLIMPSWANYRPPACAGAAAPLVAVKPSLAPTPPRAWWRLYNDPSLDALVRKRYDDRDLAAATLT